MENEWILYDLSKKCMTASLILPLKKQQPFKANKCLLCKEITNEMLKWTNDYQCRGWGSLYHPLALGGFSQS